ncbi:MAG: hypothetical protein P1U78_04855 [Alcanivoracaceae bacterium]|nr:hypothetical protein [Alcanivoracaceae bacterium]
MTLSEEIQGLIYDVDAILDGSSGHVGSLESLREKLGIALLRQSAIEMKAATEDYLHAKQCLDEAKSCVASATTDLQKTQTFIEKVTKVVSAVERLIS